MEMSLPYQDSDKVNTLYSENFEATATPFALRDRKTFAREFWARCEELGSKVAMREKHLGVWREFSWWQYAERARLAAMALVSLGVQRGECVTIMSENRPEWLFAEMGAQCAGRVSAGIYTTDSAKQVAYLLSDCQSRVHFVENDEQLDKVLEVVEQLTDLVKIVIFNTRGLERFSDPRVITYDNFEQLGRDFMAKEPLLFENLVNEPNADDTTMLIYTSGTTGNPKGAMLSNINILFQMSAWHDRWKLNESDDQLCFLPLCHIAEKLFSVILPIYWGSIVNFVESPETVAENMLEVRPHGYFAVPRVWEKFFSAIDLAMKDATPLGRAVYRVCVAIGYRRADILLEGKQPGIILSAAYALAYLVVLRPVKTLLGLERLRFAITGAAPISPELIRWYRALGVPLREAYGMTECAGAATLSLPTDFRLRYVGSTCDGIKLRLSPEGEIQLSGAAIFKGYLNQPQITASSMDGEWYRTGDIGEINDGQLRITDRMKDIIITAGGKNITPSMIESELKFSSFITDAVVIGDRRKFITCLIMIDAETVGKFAQEKQIPYTDYTSLCQRPEIAQLIQVEIEKVNSKFARVEQIKKFRLIESELTSEDEELTPTMKLRRKVINQKYANLIEAMYVE